MGIRDWDPVNDNMQDMLRAEVVPLLQRENTDPDMLVMLNARQLLILCDALVEEMQIRGMKIEPPKERE